MTAENTRAAVFRLARPDEKNAVLALYQTVIGTPFCVWNDAYPGMWEIEHDLAADSLFVLEEAGRLIGAASVAPENELEEQSVWTPCEKPGELARVVVRPEMQGRALSRLLVSSVLDEMKKRGFDNVRLSVEVNHLPAQKCYLRLGFTEVGQCTMWGHSYLLMERKL